MLYLTNCCSHQSIWCSKEGICGAAVTHSLLAAGRTWETSPAFTPKNINCFILTSCDDRKKIPGLKVNY